MIDTRQELLIALREAAELEQGLMIQYLFAGMTLKNEDDESLSATQQSLVREWRKQIYEVAREEMGHLGTVQNITVALGGTPHFAKPRFPTDAKYFESTSFTLEPLTLDTIDRFVAFEAPEEESALEVFELVPDPLEYGTVGSLYSQIANGIEALGNEKAFIGSDTEQDTTNWSSSVEVHPVNSVESAKMAIHDIIVEGEGTTAGGENSHYQRFKDIAEAYRQERESDPEFRPFRPVLANPTIFGDRPNANPIEEEVAKKVTSLFNSTYTTMLFAFSQYYKFQEQEGVPFPNINPQLLLRTSILSGLMKSVIRPLGQDVLPELIAKTGEHTFNAAPPFEQLMLPIAPWNRRSAWIQLAERLESESEYAAQLTDVHERMEAVSNALNQLASTANQLIGESL